MSHNQSTGPEPAAKDAPVASYNNKHSDDAESRTEDVLGETAHVIDSAAERALCRKFDLRLLPILAVMVRLFAPLPSDNAFLGKAQTRRMTVGEFHRQNRRTRKKDTREIQSQVYVH
jgi:hypothetical protein